VSYSSVAFLLYFLPLTLAGYYLLPRLWLKNLLLFLVSIIFYFWGAGAFVVFLPLMGIAAWLFSYAIAKTRYSTLFLVLSLIIFIGFFAWHKYAAQLINLWIYPPDTKLSMHGPLMPVGLSFIVFQSLSYLIDVYRKPKHYEPNPANVVLYLSMFPQLISGPITRAPQIIPQMKQRTFNAELFYSGVRRFVIGLGKKVLIANSLSYPVSQIMQTDSALIGPSVAWLGIIAFALQIFFDFSGYSDMAIGVGKMLGFELPENFNYPYVSRSVTEFWRRWHMTFSAWVRDYIFNPLAIQFRNLGNTGVSLALFLTFIICGLWHGMNWNFLLWGIIQGFCLAIEQLFLLKYLKKIKAFAIFYVLIITLACLVLFRTDSLYQAGLYFKALFAAPAGSYRPWQFFFGNQHIVMMIIGAILSVPIVLPDRFKMKKPGEIRGIAVNVALLLVFVLSVIKVIADTYYPFLYFKF
jgi:alginate O-acetyltransferase complex protein AlgI